MLLPERETHLVVLVVVRLTVPPVEPGHHDGHLDLDHEPEHHDLLYDDHGDDQNMFQR